MVAFAFSASLSDAPIKAIETRYQGYRFRSRLEARWAVCLDSLGWRWEYEHQGYELRHDWYLPDFVIRRSRETDEGRSGDMVAWLEIKGQDPDRVDLRKAEDLFCGSKVPVLFGVGLPSATTLAYGLPGFFDGGGYAAGIASMHKYCETRWGRPGWLLYDEPSDDDFAACDAARAARFDEHKRYGRR